MNPTALGILLALGLSAITVFADFMVKKASMQSGFSGWHALLIGGLIYGLTAIGWFFVMRKIKLSTVGAIYGVSCVLLLVLISIFYFKEKVNSFEILGISMAIASIVILFRFA